MNLTPSRSWAPRLLAAVLLAGSVGLAAPAAQAQARSAPAATRAAGTVTRSAEIQRARSWLTADRGKPVPYSQTRRWSDGYRQDCSGFASMALRLGSPGPNTVALVKSYTVPMRMADLRQGDLVIKANSNSSDERHVVLFDGWANAAHTSYWTYEQAGESGTRRHLHSYGFVKGDGYHAYHPKNLVDG
ncbi:hypothetical protein [Kitasatospora sp. NBC_01266]|uniref:hypothetical protein n=1 Tax=Kitasatospora sp. NBC_01266 TaxID=2903572 RepID=UPI002E36FA20|nr:hypothetical protein [Kitasatospora sp. NBC_01266]